INYDVPSFAEDYIHRIGRTGRAAATGDAITFVARDEEKYVRQIEKFIGKKLKFEKCEGFVPSNPEPNQEHEHRPERPQRSDRTRNEESRERSHRGKKKSFPYWRKKKR
ncbi:MAG TPA: hypothetical protein DCP47_05240, partial [Phycisphaerales bacterium]|nr:hypothetical protein [Phycisphaerales bacterium]